MCWYCIFTARLTLMCNGDGEKCNSVSGLHRTGFHRTAWEIQRWERDGLRGFLYIHGQAHINVQRRWRRVQRREWLAPDGVRDFRGEREMVRERWERGGDCSCRERSQSAVDFFFLSVALSFCFCLLLFLISLYGQKSSNIFACTQYFLYLQIVLQEN